MVFTGLLAASINTAMFLIWLILRYTTKGAPEIWKAQQICGDVALILLPLALVGAVFGRGRSRIPLAICSVLGLVVWVPVGVL
jgi:hypothetical protein